MTLSRKLTLKLAALMLSLLLLVGLAVWALVLLRADVALAHEEYQELRMIREISVHLAATRGELDSPVIHAAHLRAELIAASDALGRFVRYQEHEPTEEPKHQVAENRHTADAASTIRSAIDRIDRLGPADVTTEGQAGIRSDVAQANWAMEELAQVIDANIELAHLGASRQLAVFAWLLVILAIVIVLVAVGTNIMQYRSVVVPLRRIQIAAGQIAQGQFVERIPAQGDVEFAQLAGTFNRMAENLETLYRDLEEQVRAKSRELVRSERLASVGFLAAGVAHEINNPLNIISGYAELLLKRAELTSEPMADKLEIIRDEAFRCKRITESLLSLSRPGTAERRPVSLAALVRDVAAILDGLKPYRDRGLRVNLPPGDPLWVMGNETELKQVLLNITVNALEAVTPGNGEVVLSGGQTNRRVTVSTRDNGCGMEPEVLDHIFEPFFTARPGAARRGTGLGLAISHAIVENHQGRISAHSDGPGCGSVFTLEIPACEESSIAVEPAGRA